MERYITEEQIRQAEEFTRVYQSFGEEHAAAREAACLAAQYPAVLLPIGEEDLFAGRVEYGIVGFAPKNGEGFGYYCQDNRMREFVRGEGRKELRDRTACLLSFWENRCSRARTRAAFPEDMARALPEDNLDAPGAAFPLYRMAGWVPDYRELMRLGIPGLKEKIRKRAKDAQGEQEKELFDAMSQTLDLVSVCAKHYAAQIDHILAEDEKAPSEERRAQLLVMRNSLAVIPERPPRTMHEALQLAWLYSLLAVTMDYGRMDDYIGPFYTADLEEGRIMQEQALGLLCSLWTLIADTSETVHGRIVIGGRGRADEAAADRFALIGIGQFLSEFRDLAVAHDRRFDQRAVLEQFLFFVLIVRKVGERSVALALLVDERVQPAGGFQNAVQLAAGHTLLRQIDHLELDAALLEPALRLFGVKAFVFAENLYVHRRILLLLHYSRAAPARQGGRVAKSAGCTIMEAAKPEKRG